MGNHVHNKHSASDWENLLASFRLEHMTRYEALNTNDKAIVIKKRLLRLPEVVLYKYDCDIGDQVKNWVKKYRRSQNRQQQQHQPQQISPIVVANAVSFFSFKKNSEFRFFLNLSI